MAYPNATNPDPSLGHIGRLIGESPPLPLQRPLFYTRPCLLFACPLYTDRE